MGQPDRDADPFRILYVCTGNICRSPFAEILTRHLLIGRFDGRAAMTFDVSSAGVRAVVGSAMHPDSRDELAPWGLDVADRFTARQLRPEMVEQADVILGASRRHRAAVVELVPVRLARTFSIREFARLAAEVDPTLLPPDPVARAHLLVEQARGRRGLVPVAVPEHDDVPDPVGHPRGAHQEAAALIRSAVQVIVDVLAPPVGPSSSCS